jgi:hypothetical protein
VVRGGAVADERQGRVHVQLTAEGADRLRALSELHLAWLAEHAGEVAETWRAFGSDR